MLEPSEIFVIYWAHKFLFYFFQIQKNMQSLGPSEHRTLDIILSLSFNKNWFGPFFLLFLLVLVNHRFIE